MILQTLLSGLRDIIGVPDFWKAFTNSNGYTTYQWDYGAMFEYLGALLLVLVVVSSIFRFVCNLVKG